MSPRRKPILHAAPFAAAAAVIALPPSTSFVQLAGSVIERQVEVVCGKVEAALRPQRTTANAPRLSSNAQTSRCRFASFLGSSALATLWASGSARKHELRSARQKAATRCATGSSVQKGDIIVVVGAGGNVGRLVTQRICSLGGYQVRGVLRDAEKALSSWARGIEGLELFEADTRDASALSTALSDANAVVCTTGVPAFGFSGQWENGNHPESVDHFGVKNVAYAWSSGVGTKRRFVLMSSIGVTRRDGFPYSVLNGGGVLEAKAKGEAAVLDLAKACGFATAIVRPGQLFGGPYENNRYLGTLFQLDKDAASRAVRLEPGDTAVGDTLRSSLAGVLVRCLLSEAPALEFAVTNEEGEPPPEEDIDTLLQEMSESGSADSGSPDEQMSKRLGMAQKTFGQAIENVASGKVFDKSS